MQKLIKKISIVSVIILLLISVLLVSCSVLTTPLRQYREYEKENKERPAKNFYIYKNEKTQLPNEKLGSIIEFDDQGQFWDRRQLVQAVNEIDEQIKKNENLLTIIFAHGWINNAHPDNEKIKKFSQVLTALQKFYNNPKISKKRKVYGVVLAWRGQAVRFKALDVLSYFNRKNTASRIASGVSLTETLYTISSVASYSGSSKKDNRVIILGHSYGTILIENGLNQALTAKITESRYKKGELTVDEVKQPADLVILLNSAQNSIIPQQTIKMLGDSGQNPLIVSITSKGDWATNTTFPIGFGLTSLFGKFRDKSEYIKDDNDNTLISQRKAYSRTAGNLFKNNKQKKNEFGLLHTHVCNPIKDTNIDIKETIREKNKTKDELYNKQIEWIIKKNLEISGDIKQSEFNFKSFNGNNYKQEQAWNFKKLNNPLNKTRYWIFRVPKKIIPDHSDIFNPNSVGLVARLINGIISKDKSYIKLSPRVYVTVKSKNNKKYLYMTKDFYGKGYRVYTNITNSMPDREPQLYYYYDNDKNEAIRIKNELLRLGINISNKNFKKISGNARPRHYDLRLP